MKDEAIESNNNPLDMDMKSFKQSLERITSNRNELMSWLKDNLVDGTDYGSIKIKGKPSKPSLWKSGAEKVANVLSVKASFPSYKDYEQVALNNIELKIITIRCDLINNNGVIVSEGCGSRQLKSDYGDMNKSIKMASKSAFIDAVIKLACLSDLFTLDLEDVQVKSKQYTTLSKEQVINITKSINDNQVNIERFMKWLSKICVNKHYKAINQLNDVPNELFGFINEKLPEFANTATSH